MTPSLGDRGDGHETLTAQLATIEVLSSMLSLDGELVLSPATAAALPLLAQLVNADSTRPSLSLAQLSLDQLPLELAFTVLVTLSPDHAPPSVRLTVTLPLSRAPPSTPTTTPRLTVHQPTWLSRSAHDSFSASLASAALLFPSDDSTTFILDAIEWTRDHAKRLWDDTVRDKDARDAIASSERDKDAAGQGKLVRVWFWLPSLSTREKRDDICQWAPEYHLTGFVLAGQFRSPPWTMHRAS